jgi:hypothetical protein
MNRLEILSRILVVIFIMRWIYSYCKMFFGKEKFLPISNNNNFASISNSIGKVISNKKNTHIDKNCCLVTKVFDPKKDEFVYKYKKMDTCNVNDKKDTYMRNILVDGVNGWDNKYCKEPEVNNKNYNTDNMLGSCKNVNFECKDFIPQKNCKKFRMEWTDKTCQTTYQKPFKVKPYQMLINGKLYSQ